MARRILVFRRSIAAAVRHLVLAAVLTASLAALLAAPVSAGTNLPAIGFGEQRPGVFANRHWQDLGLERMRYVVGWDALRYNWQRHEVDAWMAAALAAGAEPLIAFTRSRAHWRKRVVPSVRTYRREFRAFHRRYPEVTDYLVWNEANHCSQPVCHRPERVAGYFDAVVEECPRCTVVGADVLDTPSMVSYVQRFQAAARHTPRVWGLHNYVDANRMQTSGTRALLRAVRGSIWFTETGGLVKRRATSPIRFPQSVSHAGRVTRFVLNTLADLSPRIKRIYIYHFENQGPKATWDSGVLSPHGRPRPAYRVLARWVARAEEARRARRAARRG